MATRIKPTDFDLTHIDILGRGPSVDSYIPRKNAFVICCHYPIVECNAIATKQHFGEYGFYPIPYITAKHVKEAVLPKSIVIRDWTVLIDSRAFNQEGAHCNTGHITYMWARAQKPKSIHLWGFDSISNNYTHSAKEIKRAVEEYDMKSVLPMKEINSVTRKCSLWSRILDSNTIVHKGE